MTLRLLKRGTAACVLYAASAICGYGQNHRFDVRDSIEMTTFSDPAQIENSPRVNFSPDGKHFFVVTSRGELQTNQVRSNLLLYDLDTVRRYLSSGSAVPPPRPRLLASVAAVPRGYASRPYAAVITEGRWSSDSRAVYFLAEQTSGSHRLYEARIARKALIPISPAHVDVRAFVVSRLDAVFFLAEREGGSRSVLEGKPLYGSARSVTGVPLQQILFSSLDNGVRPRVDGLWVARGQRPPTVLADNQSLGGPVIDTASTRWISISPDGNYAICILPVQNIPATWRDYDPLPAFEQRRIDPANEAEMSPFNFNRVKAYFLIDLRTGHSKPLVNAPFASSFGFTDKGMASWAPSGNALMVTNTYLPTTVTAGGKQHRQPCSALYISLSSNAQQCLVSSRDEYHNEKGDSMHLVDAHFDLEDTDGVFLKFLHNNSGKTVEERYLHSSGTWRKVSENSIGAVAPPLAISIHQSMQEPPTLWARDQKPNGTNPEKLLLDPNPQLHGAVLGKTQTYRWLDSTGKRWEGGLVLPPDFDPKKRYPLVIQTHGFRAVDFMADGRYPTAMAAFPLASAGIAVLQMGYSYDHVLTPQEVDDQLLGYQGAITQLTKDGFIDPHRVGIIGFSRPAWHVEGALVKLPHLFAAATLADGVDVGYMQYMIFGEGNLGMSSESDRINGGPPFHGGMPRWLDRVVDFHLDQVSTPIRIEAIGPMSLLSEWEIYSSLRQQGKPVELVYIPDGQHILQRPLDRLASQEGNVAWFCFWLSHDSVSPYCPTLTLSQKDDWERLRKKEAPLRSEETYSGAP
ncbi:MAG: hypothetical protein PW792_04540 [Acidobacteriaceae bacterium]|nr:hypothetical protein [Acidobacteriaceae bacterium]